MVFHKPVMPAETLKYLAVSSENVYVDCTAGEGGHSELILKNNSKVKLLICIEQDKDLLKIAKSRLKKYNNVLFINDNFCNLRNILEDLQVKKINGVLFDLGLSTYHYKESPKGFSFNQDAKLDMRLNENCKVNAYDIVNFYTAKELSKIIWAFGEERWTNPIVRNIIRYRGNCKIKTTIQLKKIIEKAVPYIFWKKGLHPATKTFQALRIAVNNELSNLENTLNDIVKTISGNGRIVVISYHSLEDRIVKNFFRLYSTGYDDQGIEYESRKGILNVLTKKPVTPKPDEIKKNRSARSAKLRAAQVNSS